MNAAHAKKRGRLGAKIRKGTANSMPNIITVDVFLEPDRKLVGVPANPGRQRLGFVVVSEGSEIVQVGIAAEQFERSRIGT